MPDPRSGLLVAEKQCEHCLFGKSPIVSKSRIREILRECREQDAYFVCHSPKIEDGDLEDPDADEPVLKAGRGVVCRGFYDTHTTNFIRVARRLGMIFFVDVEEKSDE